MFELIEHLITLLLLLAVLFFVCVIFSFPLVLFIGDWVKSMVASLFIVLIGMCVCACFKQDQ